MKSRLSSLIVYIIRRKKRLSAKKTEQEDVVSPEYESVVPHNTLSGGRPTDPMYAELTEHNTLYTNTQPTGQEVDSVVRVDYVDPHEV